MELRTLAAFLVVSLIIGRAADALAAAERVPAPHPQCPRTGSRVVTYSRATSGDSFIAAGGAEVRLAGILAPGSDGDTHAPSAAQASRTALERALNDRTVTLAFMGAERDRYGRFVAQVFADGEWVQGLLLRSGSVRAAPDIASDACTQQLLAAEDAARSGKRGHWRDGSYAVLSPERLVEIARQRAGRFEIVEGVVLAAAVVQGRAFLNFGGDRRTDFSVTIAPADMKVFRQAKLDPRKLKDVRLRVRGWVELYNGPEFEIFTPGAVEILDGGPATAEAPAKSKAARNQVPGR